MHYSAGETRMTVSDGPEPVIELMYRDKWFRGMNVDDLKDLEYVVKRGLEQVQKQETRAK